MKRIDTVTHMKGLRLEQWRKRNTGPAVKATLKSNDTKLAMLMRNRAVAALTVTSDSNDRIARLRSILTDWLSGQKVVETVVKKSIEELEKVAPVQAVRREPDEFDRRVKSILSPTSVK